MLVKGIHYAVKPSFNQKCYIKTFTGKHQQIAINKSLLRQKAKQFHEEERAEERYKNFFGKHEKKNL